MTGQTNSVKIPIDPLLHEWFMCVARQFDFGISISGGEYVVEYENPVDLYHFGLAMRFQPRDVLSERCRLSVNNSEEQPRRRKKKKDDNDKIF